MDSDKKEARNNEIIKMRKGNGRESKEIIKTVFQALLGEKIQDVIITERKEMI